MYLCKEQELKHDFKLESNFAYEKDLVSVIIPVCGEDISLLPECLKYIYGQDYAKIEVIIVNNGIDKQKLEFSLSSFTYNNKNLRFVHIEKNMGASYGRNEGAFYSRGEYLLFVDSDVCRIDPEVISFSVQVLKERVDIGAIGGQCSEIDDAVYLFLGRQCDKNFKEDRRKYILFEDEYVNTCNLLMRKRDFMEINGFTDFIEYIQDDLDLGFKIRKLGLKCVVDYRAVAYHPFSHKGWDNSQLWMFYKNSILFYFINYSFSEFFKFLTKKYLPKTRTNKNNKNKSGNVSLLIHRLNDLRVFFSASLFLGVRVFSVIKQRNRRQKLLNKLEKKQDSKMLSNFLGYFISKSYKQKQTFLKIVSLLPRPLKIFLIKYFVNRNKRALDNLSAPPLVYFFITNCCNMRCKHCFFLSQLNKTNSELALNEIVRIAKSLKGKIPGMTLTGGEPFMREDLEQIINCLVLQGAVKSISIATNGFLTKRILNVVEHITQKHPNVQFGLQISLDGPQSVHDKLRNKDGAYSHVMKTIECLEKLQKQRPNLSTFINIVVSRDNADCFISFYKQLLEEREAEIMFHFVRQDWRDVHGLPKDLLWPTKEKENLLPDYSVCNKMIDESEKIIGGGFLGKWRTILKKNHLKIANEGRQAVKCVAPKKGAVLFADGGIGVCEVVRPCVNLRDYNYDFLKCWSSMPMENQREKLSRCFCTYSCALMDSMLYSEDSILQVFKD